MSLKLLMNIMLKVMIQDKKRKSAVWKYFVEVKTTSKGIEILMLQCFNCGVRFNTPKSDITSQLLKHIKECEEIKAKNHQFGDLSDKGKTDCFFYPFDADVEVRMPIYHDPKNYDIINN